MPKNAWLEIMDDYVVETHNDRPDPLQVAKWAYDNERMPLPQTNYFRVMARILAQACRADFLLDEHDEPVRRRICVRRGKKRSQTHWVFIQEVTPQEMRRSLQVRRTGTSNDILQIERDRRYYNKHINLGDPIEIDHDVNIDVEEHFLLVQESVHQRSSKRKKPLTGYKRDLLKIVDNYMHLFQQRSPNMLAVAIWAYENKHMKLPRIDLFRIMARNLSKACREDFILDENGEPVHRRIGLPSGRKRQQGLFRQFIEDVEPKEMHGALQMRRTGAVKDSLQIERDRRYYNKHVNPGDPIELDYNYNIDVEEHFS